jgi:uncharacterized UBP type Zn finger protein
MTERWRAVQALRDMGFSRDKSACAMQRFGDQSSAVAWLTMQ